MTYFGRTDGILYIGPYRVEVHTAFYSGRFSLATNEKIIGFPNPFYGIGTALYNINHLPPALQAQYRNPDTLSKWTSYLYINERIWQGKLEYHWHTNDVFCHLIRQD